MADFIEKIAKYIIKYAPQYGIKVVSPIVAQAILESGWGKSELAVNAYNYFGLKYRAGRCKTCTGIYRKIGSEQNGDRSYTFSAMEWCKFNNMEDGVIGYFDFINITNYANLKGVTDPRTYLENIKKDGYATSIDYVENLMRVIKENNLTRFDKEVNGMTENTKVIALDAGHYKYTAGKRIPKALDPNETREWWLNDRINDRVEELLLPYDCVVVRVDDTNGEKDICLSKRVSAANNAGADAYVSTHQNAGINCKNTVGGLVIYYYSGKAERKEQATRLYNDIQSRNNLPVHPKRAKVVKKGYFVLANTKMPAFLIENGFMDSPFDVPCILSDECAEQTAQGIVAFLVREFCLAKKNVCNTENKKEETIKTDLTAIKNPFAEPSRDVKRGNTGNDVGWVQWYLWRFGLFVDANGNADATQIDKCFGAKTQSAVIEAQKRLGMTQTGVVTKSDRDIWKQLA